MSKYIKANHLTNYISFLIILFIASIFFFLWHTGFLTPLKVSEKEMGPFTLVYSAYQGDYSEGVALINDINLWLTQENIPSTQGFGIYYDDPRHVELKKLRAIVGHIIDTPNQDVLSEIKNKFSTVQLAKQPFLVSSFPFRSRLSVLIGIMKIYPKLEERLHQLNLKKTFVMEIYDAKKQKIVYLFPLTSADKLLELYHDKQP